MKYCSFFVAIFLTCFDSFSSSLLQKRLNPEFNGMDIAAVVMDIHSGQVLASIQDHVIFREDHSPGSLIKPFAMLAFYLQHGDHFPTLYCPPTAPEDPEGCWNRNGHGKLGVERAVAYSCNVYFRQLAEQVPANRFEYVLKSHGIQPLPPQCTTDTMIGKDHNWRIKPVLILRAYASFFNSGYLWPIQTDLFSISADNIYHPLPFFAVLRKGMGLSAVRGTSLAAKQGAGVPLLGKTGTTLLMGQDKMNWRSTQGWWIGVYPTIQPKIILMTFVRHGRGATEAAPLGGKILKLYLQSLT